MTEATISPANTAARSRRNADDAGSTTLSAGASRTTPETPVQRSGRDQVVGVVDGHFGVEARPRQHLALLRHAADRAPGAGQCRSGKPRSAAGEQVLDPIGGPRRRRLLQCRHGRRRPGPGWPAPEPRAAPLINGMETATVTTAAMAAISSDSRTVRPDSESRNPVGWPGSGQASPSGSATAYPAPHRPDRGGIAQFGAHLGHVDVDGAGASGRGYPTLRTGVLPGEHPAGPEPSDGPADRIPWRSATPGHRPP